MLTLPILKVLALHGFLEVSEKPLIGVVMLQSHASSDPEWTSKYSEHFIKIKYRRFFCYFFFKLKSQCGTSRSLKSRIIPACVVVTFKALFYSGLNYHDLWPFCLWHQLNVLKMTMTLCINLGLAPGKVQNKTHVFIECNEGQVKIKSRKTY